jgi:ATP-dependent Clp protease protease subunit
MQFIRPDVATNCVGLSASMGTILLCAGAKGKRMALPNATIHMHPAGVGQIGGYAPDIEIHARELLRTQARTFEIMARHTGQPLERIAHDYSRDLYMDAPQALEYGIVDEIMTGMASGIANAPEHVAGQAHTNGKAVLNGSGHHEEAEGK